MRYILECLVLGAECDRHDFQHMYPHLFAWKYIVPITDGTVYHRWQYTEKRRGPKCMTHPFIVIYILHGLRQVVVMVVGNCNWM